MSPTGHAWNRLSRIRKASTKNANPRTKRIESANDELQSTNEELETAKEELQSSNDELTTVNDELESRNRDLGAANSDLANLVNSVTLPILILGRGFHIRQITPQAKLLLNLIPSDIGRPMGDIRPNIEIPDFEGLALAVINEMAEQELELQDSAGHWYSMRMRPYKTIDNRVDGVVIVFIDIDIDTMKVAETLREHLERERRLTAVVRDASDAIPAMQSWCKPLMAASRPGTQRRSGSRQPGIGAHSSATLLADDPIRAAA